jgi:H+-transporting ATPase
MDGDISTNNPRPGRFHAIDRIFDSQSARALAFWRIRTITAAAGILGLFALTFAVGMIAAGKYVLGFDVGELRTLAFVTLVFASQATIYVVRDRKRMWHSRPGGWLLLSSLLDLGIAASLAITGTLMAPLSVLTVAAALAGSIAFSLVLDAVKHVAFTRLKIV